MPGRLAIEAVSVHRLEDPDLLLSLKTLLHWTDFSAMDRARPDEDVQAGLLGGREQFQVTCRDFPEIAYGRRAPRLNHDCVSVRSPSRELNIFVQPFRGAPLRHKTLSRCVKEHGHTPRVILSENPR